MPDRLARRTNSPLGSSPDAGIGPSRVDVRERRPYASHTVEASAETLGERIQNLSDHRSRRCQRREDFHGARGFEGEEQ